MSLEYTITEKDVEELVQAVREYLLKTPKEKYMDFTGVSMTYEEAAEKMCKDKKFAMMLVREFNKTTVDMVKRATRS